MIRQTTTGKLLHGLKHRGWPAWVVFTLLLSFYVVVYYGQYNWTPDSCTTDETCWSEGMVCEEGECLPEGAIDRARHALYQSATVHMEELGWAMFRGLDEAENPDGSLVRDGLYNEPNGEIDPWEHFGSRWTIYGLLYTFAISLGGAYVISKYRHNRYQVVRTCVVMFVQITLAFSVPMLLKFFNQPEYYFSYLWPLKIEYLNPLKFGEYGPVYVVYGFFASLVLMPVLTLLYGKRWYCSWVCGCGGLANTFGEPWRHLSSKSSLSWKIEKVTIHSVLVIAIVTTAIWFMHATMPDHEGLARVSERFEDLYALLVVATLSGVVGVAFYPIGGTRIWCRFFCPMAALLGLIQKLGRYRIKVKRDMCISCGMCSTYCEMGIDVRAYAQANLSFTPADCVGCGLCAEVCPRGVLRLENAIRRDPQELSWTSLIDESWKSAA